MKTLLSTFNWLFSDGTYETFKVTEFHRNGTVTAYSQSGMSHGMDLSTGQAFNLQFIYDPNRFCGFEDFEDFIQNTSDLFAEVMFVPNEWLPLDYQNHKQWEINGRGERSYGATVAEIRAKYEQKHGAKERRENHDEERARRVERMAAEFDAFGEFTYDDFVHDAESSARTADLTDLLAE